MGFGGHHFSSAPRPSVTSIGPRGFALRGGAFGARPVPRPNVPLFPGHRRGFFPGAYPLYVAPYGPYLYDYDYLDQQQGDDSAQGQDDRGGPTIFDRNGAAAAPAPEDYEQPQRAAAPEPPAEDEPQTVLVFKDGHRLEVQNYAIVGSSLYDLSPGQHRKIALADLDLAATSKANDDRGLDFQLPGSSQDKN